MNKPGEKKLPHLFQNATWGRFTLENRIKYGACCVSNYNERDGKITPRELARTKVIADWDEFLETLGLAFLGACR